MVSKARQFKWTYQEMSDACTPEPFDRPTGANIDELDAPDGSTTFLMRFGGFDEAAGRLTFYAIEAPRNCPMRAAFEWGEIAWDEYWTHKDWIYRLIKPFNPGPVESEIISPSEIDQATMARLNGFGDLYPYELKRRYLYLTWKYSSWNGRDQIKSECEYLEFMERYGHRFSTKAA